MKICAYIQATYAKNSYKKDCFNMREFLGLRIIIDALERRGFEVEYAGKATVHKYDFVLVSITSAYDWWDFIKERLTWQRGNYKVIIGGAGMLHISPFLPFADYFVWGRGENVVPDIVAGKAIDKTCVAEADTFSENEKYYIKQDVCYPHTIIQSNDSPYNECAIGCNHKCYFCGYTWHRRFTLSENAQKDSFQYTGKFVAPDTEIAILDAAKDYSNVKWQKLRTTAIDGFSERLRFMVNKRITRERLLCFITKMIISGIANSGAETKPHKVRFFNIIGLPTETREDFFEWRDLLREADKQTKTYKMTTDKKWFISLHCTPFNAVPASPMACAPMAYVDYHTVIPSGIEAQREFGIAYDGQNLWSSCEWSLETLATTTLNAIVMRGTQKDTDNIIRLCKSGKFWRQNTAIKQAVLEKLFDVKTLFGGFTAETLPSRYLRTYVNLEPFWNNYHLWHKRN